MTCITNNPHMFKAVNFQKIKFQSLTHVLAKRHFSIKEYLTYHAKISFYYRNWVVSFTIISFSLWTNMSFKKTMAKNRLKDNPGMIAWGLTVKRFSVNRWKNINEIEVLCFQTYCFCVLLFLFYNKNFKKILFFNKK